MIKKTIFLCIFLLLGSANIAAVNTSSNDLKANKSGDNNTSKTLAASKAQETTTSDNPIEMLNNSIVTTQNLLIKESKTLSQNPKKLLDIINAQVMPILATDIIAQLLVGKERWKGANPESRQQFIERMTHLLANTYAANVAQAGQYKIEIYPFINDNWKDQRLVVVKGKIINLQKNNGQSDLNIYLLKTKEKQWKVYDLSVAGVSILDNLKEQFAHYKTLKDINQAIESKNVNIKPKK